MKIIYIAGAGRSGSTVLDIILGNHPDVVGVGELSNLYSQGFQENRLCSCSQHFEDCDVWGTVKSEWEAAIGAENVPGFFEQQARLQRIRHAWKIDRLCNSGDADIERFKKQFAALYQSILTATGKSVIVDSSKHPIRPRILASIPEIDLRVVHLVRDARGVVNSQLKHLKADEKAGVYNTLPGRSLRSSLWEWIVVNLVSGTAVKRAGQKGVRINYEELTGDPQATFAQLSQACEVDFSALANRIVCGEGFANNHLIAGNRLRMAESVQLKPDFKWHQNLPAENRRQVWRLAGWLMKRYGYVKQPELLQSTASDSSASAAA